VATSDVASGHAWPSCVAKLGRAANSPSAWPRCRTQPALPGHELPRLMRSLECVTRGGLIRTPQRRSRNIHAVGLALLLWRTDCLSRSRKHDFSTYQSRRAIMYAVCARVSQLFGRTCSFQTPLTPNAPVSVVPIEGQRGHCRDTGIPHLSTNWPDHAHCLLPSASPRHPSARRRQFHRRTGWVALARPRRPMHRETTHSSTVRQSQMCAFSLGSFKSNVKRKFA
jgi:hypothetical protein